MYLNAINLSILNSVYDYVASIRAYLWSTPSAQNASSSLNIILGHRWNLNLPLTKWYEGIYVLPSHILLSICEEGRVPHMPVKDGDGLTLKEPSTLRNPMR